MIGLGEPDSSKVYGGNVDPSAVSAWIPLEDFAHVSWKWDCVQIYLGGANSGLTLVSGRFSIRMQEFSNMCTYVWLCDF